MKITKFEIAQPDINLKFRNTKEFLGGYNVIYYNQETNKFKNPIDIRFYIGRSNNANRVSCACWITTGKGYFHSSGFAAGYGYDKRAAAFEDACRKLGIKFDNMNDIRGAINLILSELGYNEKDCLIQSIGA